MTGFVLPVAAEEDGNVDVAGNSDTGGGNEEIKSSSPSHGDASRLYSEITYIDIELLQRNYNEYY